MALLVFDRMYQGQHGSPGQQASLIFIMAILINQGSQEQVKEKHPERTKLWADARSCASDQQIKKIRENIENVLSQMKQQLKGRDRRGWSLIQQIINDVVYAMAGDLAFKLFGLQSIINLNLEKIEKEKMVKVKKNGQSLQPCWPRRLVSALDAATAPSCKGFLMKSYERIIPQSRTLSQTGAGGALQSAGCSLACAWCLHEFSFMQPNSSIPSQLPGFECRSYVFWKKIKNQQKVFMLAFQECFQECQSKNLTKCLWMCFHQFQEEQIRTPRRKEGREKRHQQNISKRRRL